MKQEDIAGIGTGNCWTYVTYMHTASSQFMSVCEKKTCVIHTVG